MLKKGCFWAFFMGFLVTFWAFFSCFLPLFRYKKSCFVLLFLRISSRASAPPVSSAAAVPLNYITLQAPRALPLLSCPLDLRESSAGSFLRFQSLLLYSRKSPPFLYGQKILFYSVSKFSFFKSAAPFVRFALENPFIEITPQNSRFFSRFALGLFLWILESRPPLPCGSSRVSLEFSLRAAPFLYPP